MNPPRVLLVFHTAEGQTERIADRIAFRLRNEGLAVDEMPAGDAPSPVGYSGVVLGDSIHNARHSRELTRYVTENADELHHLPVALFQVSLTSATDDAAHSALAHSFVHKLLDETGLDPDIVGLFAGALAYTRYGWLKRHMMHGIAKRDFGETDQSHDVELTDWDAVEEYASDVVALIHARSSPAPH